MAFSFIPQSVDDINSSTQLSSTDKANLSKVFEMFIAMTSKNGKPQMQDPFAIDVASPKNIKIHRSFTGEVDLKILSKSFNISFSFGNGSRGNMGANNRGTMFERQLTTDFDLYAKIRNPDNDQYIYKKFIKDFHKQYGKGKIRNITVLAEGDLNKRRPLVFSGNDVFIEKPHNQANVGSTVTDITVSMDHTDIYLSCKLGGTVTFFNIGVTKYLKPEEIMAGEIKNKQGKILLDIFGLNPVWFASVFKAAASPKDRNSVEMPKNLMQDVTGKINKRKTQNFLISGIGYGYHLVHAKNASSTDIDHMVMTESEAESYVKVNRIICKYPSPGSAKRVDVIIDTPKFKFKLNFRSKGGGIFPSHLLCDYQIVHL